MPITLNPQILSGKPIIEGTRISVEFILDLLSSGTTMEEILKEYLQLKKEDILESLNYAKKILKREEVLPLSTKAA